MRCLVSEAYKDSLNGRIIYFYKCLNLWFLKRKSQDGFCVLESVPANCIDICFIIGHNNNIIKLLKSTKVKEKTIVLITCDLSYDFAELKMVKDKDVYISCQKNNMTELLDGTEYNFDFDISKSEILFYNNRRRGDIYERLDKAFTKVK